MQGPVPASIREVTEPLSEAHRYERLQWQRRRGLLNLVNAVAILALSALLVVPAAGGQLRPVWLWLLVPFAFAFAVGFRALRRNPTWKPVIVDPALDGLPLAKDTSRLMGLVLMLAYLFSRILAGEAGPRGTFWAILSVVAACMAFTVGAKRGRDGLLASLYGILMLSLATLLALGAIANSWAMPVLFVGVAAALGIAGAWRRFAPARLVAP